MKQVPYEIPAPLMEQGSVSVEAWLVEPMAEFEAGVSLALVETSIVQAEVVIPYPGKLLETHVFLGGTVRPGEVIATIEVTDWVFENLVSK